MCVRSYPGRREPELPGKIGQDAPVDTLHLFLFGRVHDDLDCVFMVLVGALFAAQLHAGFDYFKRLIEDRRAYPDQQ